MSGVVEQLRAQGLDPRVTPARDDLAAETLRGRVAAPRYAPGRPLRVAAPRAGLWNAPRQDRGLETELLWGERFTVYDEREGWAWGQSAVDGYVGYVAAEALAAEADARQTHKVAVARTLVFPEPDLRVTPIQDLPREARITVTAERDGFARLSSGAFIFARHLAAFDQFAPTAAAVALDYAGVPYLWGGRTSLGLDCSGLVQICFAAKGVKLPRDSDQQAAAPADTVANPVDLCTDDLVFWERHVALMIDPERMIHASAFHGAVVVEPLAEAVARIAPVAGPVLAMRRLA